MSAFEILGNSFSSILLLFTKIALVAQKGYYEDKIKTNPDGQFAGTYSNVDSGTTIKDRKWLE